jgi:hypothetical protein
MLQANELRIQNAFLFDYGDHKDVIRLHGIYEKDGHGFAVTYGRNIPLEKLIPIPLTPEILEACGFVNNDYQSWYLSWESYELQYSGHDKELGILSPDGCTSGHTVYFPCQYLHHLQNLYFALTASELPVNLQVITK